MEYKYDICAYQRSDLTNIEAPEKKFALEIRKLPLDSKGNFKRNRNGQANKEDVVIRRYKETKANFYGYPKNNQFARQNVLIVPHDSQIIENHITNDPRLGRKQMVY